VAKQVGLAMLKWKPDYQKMAMKEAIDLSSSDPGKILAQMGIKWDGKKLTKI